MNYNGRLAFLPAFHSWRLMVTQDLEKEVGVVRFATLYRGGQGGCPQAIRKNSCILGTPCNVHFS